MQCKLPLIRTERFGAFPNWFQSKCSMNPCHRLDAFLHERLLSCWLSSFSFVLYTFWKSCAFLLHSWFTLRTQQNHMISLKEKKTKHKINLKLERSHWAIRITYSLPNSAYVKFCFPFFSQWFYSNLKYLSQSTKMKLASHLNRNLLFSLNFELMLSKALAWSVLLFLFIYLKNSFIPLSTVLSAFKIIFLSLFAHNIFFFI